MAEDQGSNSGGGNTPLAQIPLRRVSRAELEASKKSSGAGSKTAANPMNRLVPYLDLFNRLTDSELGRLTSVPPHTVAQLRKQVDAVCDALGRFADLLARLDDNELMRLTGASAKTVRFWRLCQPRRPGDVVQAVAPIDEAPDSGPVDRAVVDPTDIAGSPGPVAASRASTSPTPAVGVPVRTATEPSGERTVSQRIPVAAQSGSHPALGDRELRPAADSGHNRVVNESATTKTGKDRTATDRELADDTNDSQLSVEGAPFPGYEYDPKEAAALDTDDDGIVIGLELSDG